ncbi:hypothetical protein EDF62_2331 [Leucobacter luti]|uniref:Uncharacterized protein n=1 Tax=Leucobacter luti TaxID=340320 RepID=A0A4R6RXA1_9MICO|nr:hypothetical protein [Leucobacter luti]TDP91712.1 hypothetical protein EDF62_2331 [Leucobacter luti]
MTDPVGSDGQGASVSTRRDRVRNGQLTLRTVWGSPLPHTGFAKEIPRITQRVRTVGFSDHLDVFLTGRRRDRAGFEANTERVTSALLIGNEVPTGAAAAPDAAVPTTGRMGR